MNTKLKLIQEHPEIKEMLLEIAAGASNYDSAESAVMGYIITLEEKPLFITNGDNEEVFEGDTKVTAVYERHANMEYVFLPDFDANHAAHIQKQYGAKIFKSREKAEQYLITNARVLSIADHEDWRRNKTVEAVGVTFHTYAETIVKQRLNIKP